MPNPAAVSHSGLKPKSSKRRVFDSYTKSNDVLEPASNNAHPAICPSHETEKKLLDERQENTESLAGSDGVDTSEYPQNIAEDGDDFRNVALQPESQFSQSIQNNDDDSWDASSGEGVQEDCEK